MKFKMIHENYNVSDLDRSIKQKGATDDGSPDEKMFD